MTDLSKTATKGAIIIPAAMESEEVFGCRTTPLVKMDTGTTSIKCQIIHHEPGQTLAVHIHPHSDDIMLVFQGCGEAFLGDAWFEVGEGDVIFAPEGIRHGTRNRTGSDRELVCYNWQVGMALRNGALGAAPDQASEDQSRLATPADCLKEKTPPPASEGIITNVEQGALFTGYGAEMRFVVWPKTGSHKMSLHKAIHPPGMAFREHSHPASADMVLAFRGRGEGYCFDGWYPMNQGDLLLAPRGVTHGTRHPGGGDPEPFICVGVGVPPQLDLYRAAGYL
ncbi:MAG: cupin domain-containing protein [Proteobacteria bacterium]|nr:cupin domain-containing protein [Pseudomonadota bacterium]MBU1449593.1 cupin domain-containing protein [Pseudomonadota bacterium]MBU2469985.1 cupin domain-containing protein [Pseudomonadota bacterium]MBU2516890.1 cupin domain-containing protein [Pseudomonadota bacterium]